MHSGARAANALWDFQPVTCQALPGWYDFLWVPVFFLSMDVLWSAHPKHWIPMAGASTIAYIGVIVLGTFLKIGYVHLLFMSQSPTMRFTANNVNRYEVTTTVSALLV